MTRAFMSAVIPESLPAIIRNPRGAFKQIERPAGLPQLAVGRSNWASSRSPPLRFTGHELLPRNHFI